MSETTASRITTVSKVYLIIALFIAIIICFVFLIQIQMDALTAIRAYVGGEGLWAKAQKDAVHSMEHYAMTRDEADYRAYQRLIQVPLGDRRARIELQKENPDIAVVLEGFVRGRNHPDDFESLVRFFRRFQHTAYMSQVIGHWTTGDRMIAELNGVAEALHEEVASGRNNPEVIRSYLTRLDDINRQVTVEEDLFSSTLAEASRWANDVSRNLTYAIALLFVALGVALSWPIITRIRATESALSESEERFHSIFEHVGDILFTVEPDRTFSSISPSSERMLGWSPDELISRPFPLFIHPDDLPRMQELFMKAQAGESPPVFQVRILTKAGGYLESEIAVSLLHRGDSIVILGVVRDITERKQAENALRKSKDLLQSIVENVPARIFWKDRDSRYLGCNTQFAKDAGHSRPDELTGKTDFEMGWKDQAELYRADDKTTMESGNPKLDYEEPQTTPDGSAIWLRTSKVPLRDESKRVIGILGLYQDITERKRAGEALRESQARLDLALRSAGMGVWHWDIVENRRYFDAQVCRLLGIDPATFTGAAEEFVGVVHPDDREMLRAALARTVEQDVLYEPEYRAVWPDGSVHYITARGRLARDDNGRPARVSGIIWDITERKRAEQELRENEEMLSKIAVSAQDAILMLDNDGNIALWNAAAEKMFGYSSEEALGKDLHLLLAPARFHEAHRTGFRRFRSTGEGAVIGKTLELAALRKDGTEFAIELSLSAVKLKDKWNAVGIVRDITERKKSEEGLKLFRALIDQSTDAIEVLDPETLRFLDVNQKACLDLGYSREELLSLSAFDIDPMLDRSRATEFAQGLRKLGFMIIEGRHRRKDGSEFPVEINIGYVQLDQGYVISVIRDITQRKQSALALERANRALRTLSACNEALVRAGNEAELLDSICRIIVETGGYRMAWVGFPEQDPAKTVRPVAQYGHEEGFLAEAKFSWGDTELGRGPTGTAIRTGTVQVNQNFLTNPALAPWREAMLKRGYQSSIALPLKNSAGTLGVLTIHASEPDAFNEAEVTLLQELAEDLAFGIEILRTRADRDRIAYEHIHHAEILRRSLEDSIKAIADTVEMRDPYTAGHQKRVSQLAVAISGELGLPEETIHGIELAASIHDLGKIKVPAEILSKPGMLTDVELMLIKMHPQAGYDILKDIKFPWPIATMVLQHHERLDGSGYPQGLKDGQILLESRIMAVADVVEALASHRPYRAALGVDMALKEIERGRGTTYDAAVVDACLRLFREKRFALST